MNDQVKGYFGPGSMQWMIGREAVLFAGGGYALLLQLAHPAVAAGVVQHSHYQTDLIGRTQRTFEAVYAITFGDRTTADEAARRMYGVHERVKGRVEESTQSSFGHRAYHALDPALLFWVQATLIEASLQMFELFVRPLTRDEKEGYYQESRVMSGLYGIPDAAVPPDYRAFQIYFQRMLEGAVLEVTPGARAVYDLVFKPISPLETVLTAYQHLTALLLPVSIREGYGMAFGLRDRLTVEAIVATMNRALPHVPPSMRYVPAYFQALERVARAEGRPLPRRRRVRHRIGAQLVSAPVYLFLKLAGGGRPQEDHE